MGNSLADSNSIAIDSILVPHSNAISILTLLLMNNKIDNFNWLDLACGKGQILMQLGDNLDSVLRNKISLSLVDINNNALRDSVAIAEDLDLKEIKQDVNDLYEFCHKKLIKNNYKFITLINSLHEIKPLEIGTIILKSIIGLDDDGIMFLFVQESLPAKELELGAITWSSFEIIQVFNDFFELCGTDFRVSPNKWNHSKNTSWSLQISKKMIGLSNDILEQNIDRMNEIIKDILVSKLDIIKKALLSTTNNGETTDIEDNTKIRNLYDFWSLSKAMEDY